MIEKFGPRAAALAAVLALGAGWSGSALGQVRGDTAVTTPVNRGAFYWSFGASGGVQHMPKWSYGQNFRVTEEFSQQMFNVTIEDLGSAFDYDPKVPGGGPAFAVGYALDKRTFLGRIGAKPSIEFGLWTFFGKTTQSASTTGIADEFSELGGTFYDLVFPAVDGSTAYNFRSQDLKLKLESSVQSGEASLRFKTQFQVGRRLMIVPSVGPIGGLAFYRYRLRGNIAGGGLNFVSIDPDSAMDIKETIRSYHFGGEAAMNVVFAARPNLLIQGGVAIAGFHRTSSLNARSQFALSGFRTSPGFSDIQAVRAVRGGTTEIASTNDTGSTFGYRLGVNASITYSWGWARLTLSGFGSYDSAIPGVNNPSSSSISGPYSSATIKHDGEWAYGGSIALSFPLH